MRIFTFKKMGDENNNAWSIGIGTILFLVALVLVIIPSIALGEIKWIFSRDRWGESFKNAYRKIIDSI